MGEVVAPAGWSGSLIAQHTPVGANARSTEPPSSRGTRSRMTLAPYLCCGEASTAGPPISRHVIDSVVALPSGEQRPVHLHAAMRRQQCAVLCRVRREFVQHHCEGLARGLVQRDSRTADDRGRVAGVGRELPADEFGEIDAGASRPAEQRMGIGDGLDAALQHADAVFGRRLRLVRAFGRRHEACQQLIERRGVQALLSSDCLRALVSIVSPLMRTRRPAALNSAVAVSSSHMSRPSACLNRKVAL